MPQKQCTVLDSLLRRGISRRGFLQFCTLAASALALPAAEASRIAAALAKTCRPRVVWLHFQECTACTEALTRAFDPTLENLLLDIISLEYHETLMVASGKEAKELVEQATQTAGYVLIVEGALSYRDGWCTIGGHNSIEELGHLTSGAALVIAVGSCAAYGGLPRAAPDPSHAVSVGELMSAGEIDVPSLINLPGCPPIPEVLTGTIIHFLTYGIPPEVDRHARPLCFYGRTVHHRCPRKASYKAGRFAESFDDEGARKGWCLLHLGCKGPVTRNACSMLGWNQGTSMPMHSGHGCLGCSEAGFWDRWENRGGIYAALGANNNQSGGKYGKRKTCTTDCPG